MDETTTTAILIMMKGKCMATANTALKHFGYNSLRQLLSCSQSAGPDRIYLSSLCAMTTIKEINVKVFDFLLCWVASAAYGRTTVRYHKLSSVELVFGNPLNSLISRDT